MSPHEPHFLSYLKNLLQGKWDPLLYTFCVEIWFIYVYMFICTCAPGLPWDFEVFVAWQPTAYS